MAIYLFYCRACDEEVEVECAMDRRKEQCCPNCDAPPEDMKQLINTHIEPNFSWKAWDNGANKNE